MIVSFIAAPRFLTLVVVFDLDCMRHFNVSFSDQMHPEWPRVPMQPARAAEVHPGEEIRKAERYSGVQLQPVWAAYRAEHETAVRRHWLVEFLVSHLLLQVMLQTLTWRWIWVKSLSCPLLQKSAVLQADPQTPQQAAASRSQTCQRKTLQESSLQMLVYIYLFFKYLSNLILPIFSGVSAQVPHFTRFSRPSLANVCIYLCWLHGVTVCLLDEECVQEGVEYIPVRLTQKKPKDHGEGGSRGRSPKHSNGMWEPPSSGEENGDSEDSMSDLYPCQYTLDIVTNTISGRDKNVPY